MRKILAVLLVLVMMASCACAEETDLLRQIRGKLFEFSSGVGGWSTEIIVGEDGNFSGNFHDSEMGETGEGYPDGTLYGCYFQGQFFDLRMVDEYTWTMGITVEMDEGQAPETIEGGIRYVTSPPYGVEKAQTVTLYLPGTPVDRLPEGFMFWSHLQEIDPDAKVIPYYAIWNEEDEAGFITGPVTVRTESIVVTALASEVNPDALASVAVNARITGYKDGFLTAEIIVPEAYDAAEIESLRVDDTICTQGQEVKIRSITEEDGYIILNKGDYEFSDGSVWLYQGIDMNYEIAEYDDHTWNVLATIKVPVSDHLIFLDGIDPSSGESLRNPTVHNGADFLSMMGDAMDPGFAANNVMVVFDEHGDLALIQRYYVPWQ